MVLAILLFLCAKPISLFFDSPELVSITRAMLPVMIINALAIVWKARLTKKNVE
jgi:hypothetical protein